MALVQEPDYHPHVAHYAFRLVALSAKSSLPMDHVEQALRAGASGGSAVVRKSIEAASILELLEVADGAVRIHKSVRPKDAKSAANDPVAFRRLARRRALEPSRTDPSIGSRRGTSDFAHLAAWLTHVGPTHLSTSIDGFETELVASFQQFLGESTAEWPIKNKEHWLVFCRWFQFLGLGWDSGPGLVADAHVAVGEELNAIFGELHEMTMAEFVKRVSDRLPHLDGGVHEQLVAAKRGALDPVSLSTALGVAIARLNGDRIELSKRADGDVMATPVGDHSHIKVIR